MSKTKNVLIIVMLLSFITLVGCKDEEKKVKADGNIIETENESDKETNQTDMSNDIKDELNGLVSVSGSTSVEKIGIATAEEFMAINPDVEVTYVSIGSSNGVKNAKDGITIFGTVSRNLKKRKKSGD